MKSTVKPVVDCYYIFIHNLKNKQNIIPSKLCLTSSWPSNTCIGQEKGGSVPQTSELKKKMKTLLSIYKVSVYKGIWWNFDVFYLKPASIV